MKFDYKIEPPISSLVKELEALQEGLGEKGIRSALVSGARPLKATMKRMAPVDKGNLSKAVGHVSISKRAKARLGVKEGMAAILVGANRKIPVNGRKVWQGKKGHWMEEGTEHMRPRPFMAPALAATAGSMEPLFYRGIANYLERERAKRNY